MNRLIFYMIAFLSIVTTISVCGQRTVTGRLVDKETGKPVKDASITQIGTDIKTTSNVLGFFQFQVDSTVIVEIASSDYPTMQVKLPEVNSFKIELTKPPVTVKPVDEVFTVYEDPASFPGGMQSFYNYINKNIKFPKEVKNGTINGKVLVDFVIDSTGQIPPDEVKIKQGLCKPCDEEAIRLIKGSPKWNPGVQRDKPVRQRMIMPIMFK